jgi:hypothetical protein
LTSQAHALRYKLAVLQEQVVLRKLADVAPKMKNDCVVLLLVALNLPAKAPKAQLSAAETASWSLSRTKSTHIYIAKRWNGDGVGGGGGNVREQLVAACHDCFPGPYTDEQVIGMACDKSSFFYGRYNVINNEIYFLLVEPFVAWQRGNMTTFLQRMPAMVQHIATVPRKTNITKCILSQLERTVHLTQNHPDVLQHMGANCTALREDHIEIHHSALTHWVNKHIKNVEHRHYLLASGLTWPAARMKKSVGRLLSRRVEEGQQEDVILKRTEKPVWAASNAKLDAWLLGDFIAILEGVKAGNDWSADTGRLGDAMWPRAATVQRQTLTQPRLESVCLPEMVKYLERVRADGPEVATAAAGGGLGGGGLRPLRQRLWTRSRPFSRSAQRPSTRSRASAGGAGSRSARQRKLSWSRASPHTPSLRRCARAATSTWTPRTPMGPLGRPLQTGGPAASLARRRPSIACTPQCRNFAALRAPVISIVHSTSYYQSQFQSA